MIQGLQLVGWWIGIFAVVTFVAGSTHFDLTISCSLGLIVASVGVLVALLVEEGRKAEKRKDSVE